MRRTAILLAGWLLTVAATAAELKIATLYPPGSDAVTRLRQLSDDWRAATNGALSLKLYPGGVMGDDATLLRKMRIGQLDGALVSSGTLERLGVVYGDLSQPFRFETLDAVYDARTAFDARLRARLAKHGWAGFGPLDGGFSYVLSSRPVTDLDALRARDLWLPNTEAVRALAQRLSVDYAVLGIADVLPALDTGAVDALIAPPSAALTLGWHARLDYVTDQPVIYTWGILIVPQRVLDRLPESERDRVRSGLTRWAGELDARLRQSNRRATEALFSLLKPVSIVSTDLAEIRAQLADQSASR